MVKIVVDSGCSYAVEMKEKMGIDVELVPLNLQANDVDFIDDTNLNVSDYLDAMEKSKTDVKTAAPSPELYMNNYKGGESVFAITLSSKLSGSYNSAMLAKDMYLSEVGSKFIHVFDSLSAAVGEMLIALKINELARLNKTEKEIVDKVNDFISGMETFFILEKYDNLVRTGRLNPYVAKLASMLSIKPVCKADNGIPVLFDKARGFNKAVSKMVDAIVGQNKNFEERILGITHVKDLAKAEFIKAEILKRVKFKDVIITETTGLCATYAMRSGIIVSY